MKPVDSRPEGTALDNRKSANIILADADLAKAARMGAHMIMIVTSEHGCPTPTRLLVEDSVHDEAVARVQGAAELADDSRFRTSTSRWTDRRRASAEYRHGIVLYSVGPADDR
ncbi:aldehyde dehydrogenase family protein [Frankia gtarii]|uniref:aldehyde dehydrogenase family protein n=1 Tax=Frankia gtarii TaxID=2950102 RepID=UPI0021BEABFC|nr:aldehyde dehydrogenase family protein [Frankia gtarii]